MSDCNNRPLPLVLPDDDGIRPNGRPDECFYCRSRVGRSHLADCVMLRRMVKVRYSFTLEIEMPHSFSKQEIEFNRNESSWCADNAIDELVDYWEDKETRDGGCLCNDFECEVIEIPEAEPYRKNRAEEVVP